jgi:hypothetical protein
MTRYETELKIVIIGVACSFVGWVVNQINNREVTKTQKKIERYQTALTTFYWPLYYEIQNLEYFMNLDDKNEELLSSIVLEISENVKRNLGLAFPKKLISHPLLILIPKLLRGVMEKNVTKYVSVESVRFIHLLTEARIITLTKKLNVMCGEQTTDRYTLAMYSKALNFINQTNNKEWLSPFDWRFKDFELKQLAQDYKCQLLNYFYDVTYQENLSENQYTEYIDIDPTLTTSGLKKTPITGYIDSNDSTEYIKWLKYTNTDYRPVDTRLINIYNYTRFFTPGVLIRGFSWDEF